MMFVLIQWHGALIDAIFGPFNSPAEAWACVPTPTMAGYTHSVVVLQKATPVHSEKDMRSDLHPEKEPRDDP